MWASALAGLVFPVAQGALAIGVFICVAGLLCLREKTEVAGKKAGWGFRVYGCLGGVCLGVVLLSVVNLLIYNAWGLGVGLIDAASWGGTMGLAWGLLWPGVIGFLGDVCREIFLH